VIFALAGTVLIGAAALAFDTGVVLLEKRTQQNAADASALAGARFLPNTGMAHTRAQRIAGLNGFVDGAGDVQIEVTFPTAGYIRVTIENTRPSYFARVFGIDIWDVTSTALAANIQGMSGPAALHALNPHECSALVIEGNGTTRSSGNIQVNSDCDDSGGAFRVAGNGALRLQEVGIVCNVVGGSSSDGNAQNACEPPNEGADAVPDPFAGLAAPPMPPLPQPVVLENAAGPTVIAAACPGELGGDVDAVGDATLESPGLCEFGGPEDRARVWRLFPGLYPGGLNLQNATFLLEPGIYYIAGGGFRTSNATVITVDEGGTTPGGGMLIFNTDTANAEAGQIVAQGGGNNWRLYPLNYDPLNCSSGGEPWDRMLIFQDRHVTETVEIVGGGTDAWARGLIYAPAAKVVIEAAPGTTLTIDAVISDTIQIKGNGTVNVEFNECFLPSSSIAGLVE
jgi:hypothetical protein